MSLFESDDFAGRPYGFTTNQISHATVVGFLGLVYGSCITYFLLFGELPYKEHLIAFAAFSYASYEYWNQGWNGWDTIEDWWFVVVYGVIGPVMTFSEITAGVPIVSVNLFTPLPFIALFAAHLAAGAYVRSR